MSKVKQSDKRKTWVVVRGTTGDTGSTVEVPHGAPHSASADPPSWHHTGAAVEPLLRRLVVVRAHTHSQ